MKRPFSVFDGIFLLFLYFKITQEMFSWVVVFSPYGMELFFFAAGVWLKAKMIPKRLEMFLWRIFMYRRVDQAAERARNFMKENYEKGRANAQAGRPGGREGANPGRYTDPSKEGK